MDKRVFLLYSIRQKFSNWASYHNYLWNAERKKILRLLTTELEGAGECSVICFSKYAPNLIQLIFRPDKTPLREWRGEWLDTAAR